MSKRIIGIAVVLLLLLIAGVIWAFKGRADAQVEKLKHMQDEMYTAKPPQREQFVQFGRGWKELSLDQRGKVQEHEREIVQRQMQSQVDQYFRLPPEKRNDYLDNQIQNMEIKRKEMEMKRRQPTTVAEPAPNASPEAQSRQKNRFLDNTSPEMRAKLTAYIRDLQKRRVAQGLPAGGDRILVTGPPEMKLFIGF